MTAQRDILRIFLLVVLTTGCAAPRIWMADSGRVLDWETKQPLEGVIVVARWQGYVSIPLVDVQRTCYHVESTQTDADGRFRIPGFAEGVNTARQKHVDLQFYKAGYRWSLDEERNRFRMYHKEGLYFLEKDDRDRAERLGYISQVAKSTNCHGAGASERASYELYKKLYEEAKNLSKSEKDQKTVAWLRQLAASKAIAESGNVPAASHREKVNRFLEDHLK